MCEHFVHTSVPFFDRPGSSVMFMVDVIAATMSILVVFAALGEMICPVVVGNVSQSPLCDALYI